MDAFYKHGSTGDLFALCAGFEVLERRIGTQFAGIKAQALLIESVLITLAIRPEELISSE